MKRLTKRFDDGRPHWNIKGGSGEAIAEVHQKALYRLAEIEDKIESGLVVELLCKVGDKVYQTDTNGTKIYCSTVQRIIFDGRIVYDTETIGFDKEAIGVSVFLTNDAIKAHIKKIREKKNG